MSLRINDKAPDFTAETTEGTIRFHDWIGNGWAVLFSHPKDFTPVCTTELGCMAGLRDEFAFRNCKIMGVSVDPVADHQRWKEDIAEVTGNTVDYPLIGDTGLTVAKLYGMLPAAETASAPAQTVAGNATVRSVFVIGPDKTIRLTLSYPMTTGRNFDEILRAIDSMQLTDKYSLATPAQWRPGDRVIVAPGVSDDAARSAFNGFEAIKPYLRYVEQPGTCCEIIALASCFRGLAEQR